MYDSKQDVLSLNLSTDIENGDLDVVRTTFMKCVYFSLIKYTIM